MIEQGFPYLAFLAATVAAVVQLDRRFKAFFAVVPGIVVIYFLVMLLSTLGMWQRTDEVNFYYRQLKTHLLPAMIFLMLLRCDLRRILALGPRMLAGFFAASLSIAAGFVVTFALFKGYYEPHTWKTFAALCGSWMGGTGNMVAVQQALDVKDSEMGYALLMDSINYAVWVMLLLAAVPHAARFNRFAGADTRALDAVGAELSRARGGHEAGMEFHHLSLLVGLALAVSAASGAAAKLLPASPFLTAETWTVILATLAGVAGALTPLGRTPGVAQVATLTLYLIVALIASRANFAELGQAPRYIASGFAILGVHALLMTIFAKIFKLDLFTCGVASLANIGGVASAPILAAAYSETLVPVGVLMAMMGYVVGTGGGLLVGKILSMML